MQIVRPLLGKLTQGVIFSCVRAERYDGCRNHGIILTARCDIEQDKFPVLNYIPVVNLDDWLLRDGLSILLARLAADLDGQINSTLSHLGIKKSVLLAQTPRQVLDMVFDDAHSEKKTKSSAIKFRDLVDHLDVFATLKENLGSEAKSIYTINPKFSRALLRELALNKLTGYYFLPSISPDEKDSGFVVLLRESSFLPRELALELSRGMEADADVLRRNPSWQAFLDFSVEPFSMPVGELKSPFVEHLLQSFANLFGRIGVKDLDPEYLDTICGRLPRTDEGLP